MDCYWGRRSRIFTRSRTCSILHCKGKPERRSSRGYEVRSTCLKRGFGWNIRAACPPPRAPGAAARAQEGDVLPVEGSWSPSCWPESSLAEAHPSSRSDIDSLQTEAHRHSVQ